MQQREKGGERERERERETMKENERERVIHASGKSNVAPSERKMENTKETKE